MKNNQKGFTRGGENKMKIKQYILPATVLGLATIIGTLSYVSSTNAASNGGRNMASDLAEKLGLEQSQVDDAMKDMKEEHQKEMQTEREERLQTAVTDGVITEEQKESLIEHQKEMQQKREQLREEEESWFEKNGVDRDSLDQYIGGGNGFGRGHGGDPELSN